MGFFSDRTTEGTDLTPIRDSLLNISVDIAELDYAQGLNADSSDNIWVDSFVDSSKISSSTDVEINTGLSGNISLAKTKQSESFSGFGSGNASSTAGNVVNPNKDLAGFKVTLTSDSNLDTPNNLRIERASDGTVIDQIDSVSTGKTYKLTGSLSSGTKYYIILDANNHSYVSSTFPISNTEFDITKAYLDAESTADRILNFTDITSLRITSTSGTATTTTIDKGFTPSSLQPDLELENPNDGDTTAELKAFDGNGNSTTWTESELGESKTVSFTDSSFQLELQPSTLDSTKSPQINDVGTNVIQ